MVYYKSSDNLKVTLGWTGTSPITFFGSRYDNFKIEPGGFIT